MRFKILFLFLFIQTFLFAQQAPVFHDLEVIITPDQALLKVTDAIRLNNPETKAEFSINSKLKIVWHSENVKLEKLDKGIRAKDMGMDRDDSGDNHSKITLEKYRVLFKDGKEKNREFIIKYMGLIESPIHQSEENYQRGFSESPGIISETGIYLAGSTYWLPHFGDNMMSFELTTSLPAGWKTVSQGKRTQEISENNIHKDTWIDKTPQEEVFLIGAKFHEYSFDAGKVEAMAFLRTPDEGLANKYLETTAQYLEMYRTMVGPFPYSKFALVENFWETGYGMPSFTLLGEKIIRFPFILHSSYPHELLHNWWGNSVYIDFETGNWCEGLTAYMADHLIKEQRGQGHEYRRTTLQKFGDYVTRDNDFPVNEFLSRHNSSSETIGYGKVGMIFHMLRRELGDELFIKGIQQFNRNNAFKKASWKDIQTAFENASEKDLASFIEQWTNRKGAPALKLENVTYKKDQVSFNLVQTQQDNAFRLRVPVVISTEMGKELIYVEMDDKMVTVDHRAGSAILGLEVDPMFDVFRVLHPNEVPASLSSAYGASSTTFIMPTVADKNTRLMYNDFVEAWKKGNTGSFEVIMDNELSELNSGTTYWVLGFENAWTDKYFNELKRFGVENKAKSVVMGSSSINKHANSTIFSKKHPKNLDLAMVFFSIDHESALKGLVRKLPHYGKYSYLAFEGDEPTNILKGQWEVLDSPLADKNEKIQSKTVEVKEDAEVKSFYKRAALGTLAPVFSSSRIMKDIEYLASAELKGRGLGSAELDKAAEYIAAEFEQIGLSPIGEDIKNPYFQTWVEKVKDKGEMKLSNVIGYIPGSKEEYKTQAVVVSAHYDHLGLGWPDVKKGNEGEIHFGADDNASGVAIMMELARQMKKNGPYQRPVVFVAFTGEEAGLIGSRHYVAEMGKKGEKAFANLNLDTNGRLFDKPLLVLNGNTAREWKFIFMGTEYVTGVKTELVQQELDASDQVAFNEVGVPAIQLFSGGNHDYHRPGDVIEKLDPNGMIKVASVAKEVIQYLAERTDPMPYTGKIKSSTSYKNDAPPKKERRASTGTMPDFAFNGKGVRIAAISEASPASKAGLQIGDVITHFNGKEVKNLMEYSNELKLKQPGDEVEINILRGEEEIKLKIVLGER